MTRALKVLVVAASKHGATTEIAEAIAGQLELRGIEARVTTPDEADALLAVQPRDHDAFVVGSSIYMGRWSSAAMHFVERHRELLAAHPVWLFSSGPVGEIATGADVPREVSEILVELDARGHHLFAGRLDPTQLRFTERLTVRFVHAPYGDFRDWHDICQWADGIATDLLANRRTNA